MVSHYFFGEKGYENIWGIDVNNSAGFNIQ